MRPDYAKNATEVILPFFACLHLKLSLFLAFFFFADKSFPNPENMSDDPPLSSVALWLSW